MGLPCSICIILVLAGIFSRSSSQNDAGLFPGRKGDRSQLVTVFLFVFSSTVSPSLSNASPPHNHHTQHQTQDHHHLARQEVTELWVDWKVSTGHDRGRLLILHLRRPPLPRDLLREIYLLLHLLAVEQIMTRER